MGDVIKEAREELEEDIEGNEFNMESMSEDNFGSIHYKEKELNQNFTLSRFTLVHQIFEFKNNVPIG